MCLCMANDFLLSFIKTLGNPPSYVCIFIRWLKQKTEEMNMFLEGVVYKPGKAAASSTRRVSAVMDDLR